MCLKFEARRAYKLGSYKKKKVYVRQQFGLKIAHCESSSLYKFLIDQLTNWPIWKVLEYFFLSIGQWMLPSRYVLQLAILGEKVSVSVSAAVKRFAAEREEFLSTERTSFVLSFSFFLSLFFFLFFFHSFFLSIFLYFFLYFFLSVFLSFSLSFFLSFFLPFLLSFSLSF